MIERSVPCFANVGNPDGHAEIALGKVLLEAAVEALVLEVDHRVIVADGAFQQSLGVVGRGRRDYLETGNAGEPGLGVLRMEDRAVNARSRRPPNHQRTRRASAVADSAKSPPC